MGDDDWQREPLLVASRGDVGECEGGGKRMQQLNIPNMLQRHRGVEGREEKPGQARTCAETVLPGLGTSAHLCCNRNERLCHRLSRSGR